MSRLHRVSWSVNPGSDTFNGDEYLDVVATHQQIVRLLRSATQAPPDRLAKFISVLVNLYIDRFLQDTTPICCFVLVPRSIFDLFHLCRSRKKHLPFSIISVRHMRGTTMNKSRCYLVHAYFDFFAPM